ncbi:hypothetical protein K491DRAFT_689581 [Lophiostoma macrostomum CBS 122681]|uniref:Transcription factor CBF/NF-Y/archaeal histone domain-containing protein n=1 Tax=Lophiostoma macrostomum CBS 122681 TaxID=1314788 RepID=A0A6A6TIE1_9PLEO|nr:hypothetical protein K491DRAFT_689581 [Lophiostoma macrostomum CBS 122681]
MGDQEDQSARSAALQNDFIPEQHDHVAVFGPEKDSSDFIYRAAEVKRIDYDLPVADPPPPPPPSSEPPQSLVQTTTGAATEIDNELVDAGMQSPDDEAHMDQGAYMDHGDADFEVKEQDRWLPIANVARIMKNALPENAKVSKDAKECMQECVSEFIAFITSEAAEKCHQEKRKTISGEDLLFAMSSLGLEHYAEALKVYLAKYREHLQILESQKPKNESSDAFRIVGDIGKQS